MATGFKRLAKAFSLKGLLASIKDTVGQGGRYFRWGVDDNFPNLIIEAVNDSGTARVCISRLNQFVFGHGFKDQELAKKKVNSLQKWDDLLSETTQYVNYTGGFVWRLIYAADGTIAKIFCVPIQHVRKRHDGQFLYNPSLGDPQGYHYHSTNFRQITPAYDSSRTPAEIRKMIAQQIAEHDEQIGCFLFMYQPKVGLNYEHYPNPDYSAGLNDLKADAGLSVHEEAQVVNSFKGAVIIETRTLSRDKDEDDESEYDRFNNQINDFCSPGGAPVIHMEGDVSEENTKVTALNIQHQMDATENATTRIAKKICRLFGVDPILIGIEEAGKLGAGDEIVNRMKLFNLTLTEKRELIYRGIEAIHPDWPRTFYEIEPLQLFDHIPEKVLERMTDTQINEAFDLPEISNEGMDDQAIASRFAEFGVGGVQGILGIQEAVGANTISSEAGAEVLKVIYGFTEGQAAKMLGGIIAPAEVVDPLSPDAVEDVTKREINEHMKTLTGREQQNIDRIVRKFNKAQLTDGQAVMQLTTGFGFTEEEAKNYLGIEIEEDATD